MNYFRTLVALASAAALLATSPAIAHTKLVSSTPAANATLRASPRTIALTFDERLVPAFSKFELTMPGHNNMKVPIQTRVSRDGKTIAGTPARPLAKGSYRIAWTIGSDDGHRMTGTVNFRIG